MTFLSHATASRGAATLKRGKQHRRPAKGVEHARRVAFGREWGTFAQQVSRDLRKERV